MHGSNGCHTFSRSKHAVSRTQSSSCVCPDRTVHAFRRQDNIKGGRCREIQLSTCAVFVMSSSPSVRRALPPVGVQRTVEQLLHTTTVCEWLKTVVLHSEGHSSEPLKSFGPVIHPGSAGVLQAGSNKFYIQNLQSAGKEKKAPHIWKQPWHLTSMKKEFGDCTSRFVLCFCFSSSAGGCSRSMSVEST